MQYESIPISFIVVVCINHLLAAPVLEEFLSKFFTVIIRHEYMPQLLRICTLIPIPKSGKDPSQSDNYRPNALALNLSKVLEWCILLSLAPTYQCLIYSLA